MKPAESRREIEQDQGKRETLRQHFVRSVLGTSGLGVLQQGLSLLIVIILARNLGPEGYGHYAFAIAVIGFIAIPTQIGLPLLLTREVAASYASSEWSMMRGIRRRAIQLATTTVIISLILIFAALLFGIDKIAALDPLTFVVAVILLPLWVALALTKSLLNGIRLIIHATWPGSALQPLLLLSLILLLSWVQALRSPLAVGANVIATSVAVLVMTVILKKHWPMEASRAEPSYETRKWIRSLIPFTLIGGINIINQKTDILMLGGMTTPEDVGIYNVAVQGSLLVTFSLAAFNAVLVPNIAWLHKQGQNRQLQRLLTLSTIGISIFASMTALVLFVAGEWLLDQVFGGFFVQSYSPMRILICGQLVNAFFGSVGYFLSMTGYENDTLRALSLSAVTNLLLNGLLIPNYGVQGAAIATAVSVTLWNVILGVQVYRRLNLIPGPVVLITKD